MVSSEPGSSKSWRAIEAVILEREEVVVEGSYRWKVTRAGMLKLRSSIFSDSCRLLGLTRGEAMTPHYAPQHPWVSRFQGSPQGAS